MASSIINSSLTNLKVFALLVIFGNIQLISTIAEGSLEPLDSNGGALEFYYELTSGSNNQPEQVGPIGQGSRLPEYYQQQRRRSDFPKKNLRRFLLKEVDDEGYTVNLPENHRHFIKLMVDSIEADPKFRNGRANSDIVLVDNAKLSPEKSTFGLSWQGRPVESSGIFVSPTSYETKSKSSQLQPRALALANNKLSIAGPSNSVTDYEWKRVENTRWNNLRGMWGKRSLGAVNPIEGSADKWLPLELSNKHQQSTTASLMGDKSQIDTGSSANAAAPINRPNV